MGHVSAVFQIDEMARPLGAANLAVRQAAEDEPDRVWSVRELYDIFVKAGGAPRYTSFHTVLGKSTAKPHKPGKGLSQRRPFVVVSGGGRGGANLMVKWGLDASGKPLPGAEDQVERSPEVPDSGGEDDDDEETAELRAMGFHPAGEQPKAKAAPQGPPALAKAATAVKKATEEPPGDEDTVFGAPGPDDPEPSMAELDLEDVIGEDRVQKLKDAIEHAIDQGHDDGLHTVVQKMVPEQHWHLAWLVALGVIEGSV